MSLTLIHPQALFRPLTSSTLKFGPSLNLIHSQACSVPHTHPLLCPLPSLTLIHPQALLPTFALINSQALSRPSHPVTYEPSTVPHTDPITTLLCSSHPSTLKPFPSPPSSHPSTYTTNYPTPLIKVFFILCSKECNWYILEQINEISNKHLIWMLYYE